MVDINLIGTIYGATLALRGMLAQGRGSFYKIEGLGSDGRRVEGMALYGTNGVDNNKTGVRIKWLTRGKITGRFIAAPFRKRDLFDDREKQA